MKAYVEIERARLLLDEFSRNVSEFNQLPNLSEALAILSDLITSDENEEIKKRAVNLIRTHKRQLMQRSNYALANLSEFTCQQWEYFDKAIDDFIGSEPDNNNDLTNLQAKIRKQKCFAMIGELSEKEQLRVLDILQKVEKEKPEQIKIQK